MDQLFENFNDDDEIQLQDKEKKFTGKRQANDQLPAQKSKKPKVYYKINIEMILHLQSQSVKTHL